MKTDKGEKGMRDYIFRGKRKDNGEWVEGNGIDATFAEAYILCEWRDDSVGDVETEDYEVDPETVGQYTGLTDKNGKKIFEGDILSYIEEIETRSRGKETLKGIYEVKFDYCCFSPMDCLSCNHLEIIGNIHDNQELLKGCDVDGDA